MCVGWRKEENQSPATIWDPSESPHYCRQIWSGPSAVIHGRGRPGGPGTLTLLI